VAPSRRWKGPSADWGRFALLVALGIACHFSWALTPLVQIDLHPLVWMLAVTG